MSNEQTPTDEEIQEQFETGAMVTEFSHNRTDATIAWQLWLQERDARIESAAEQRGKEQGWVEGVLYSHERHNNHAGLSPSWKFDNPYRADRLEGDDE